MARLAGELGGNSLPAHFHSSRAVRCLLVVGALLHALTAAAQPVHDIAPISPGQYAVACSNVEQDFTRIASGSSAEDYWEGNSGRYVTDLLIDPAHSFVVPVPIPDDSNLFSKYAGATFPYANLICYPTDPSNSRPGYVLPTGNVVPHMQRGAQSPIFPAGSVRFPMLLFSSGLSGSPLSGDYVESLKFLASFGYVVVAPFHGDSRFADVKLEDFEDTLYALLHYKDFVALQAVRPLSLSLALDAVVNHPDFRDHVDAANIGAFGASMGGESVLLMGGAALTTSVGQSSSRVLLDSRLKAAVGYVPYFGIDVYPAFGRDLKGLDGVTLPYLAISGTADTTAPISVTERGIRRLTNTRQLVALTGLKHGFDTRYSGEIFTWAIKFLEGQLSDAPIPRAESARMTSVIGGMEDIERIDYMAPTPVRAIDGVPVEAVVVEYYSNALGHFFITADPAEAAMLDAGIIVPGWLRTHYEFKLRPPGAAVGRSACRFYGTPPLGPNSHFFTADSAECAQVRANPLWTYEGLAFTADVPVAGDCAPDRIPVVRLYNDGLGGQASHRYTTSRYEMRAWHDRGWIIEGTVFCAIP
jgi:dienelactone hydrolase